MLDCLKQKEEKELIVVIGPTVENNPKENFLCTKEKLKKTPEGIQTNTNAAPVQGTSRTIC